MKKLLENSTKYYYFFKNLFLITSCFVMDTQLFVFFVFSSPLALKDSKIQAKYLPRSGYYALGLYKVGGSHQGC
jgi:hypothetical protein